MIDKNTYKAFKRIITFTQGDSKELARNDITMAREWLDEKEKECEINVYHQEHPSMIKARGVIDSFPCLEKLNGVEYSNAQDTIALIIREYK